MIKAVYLFRNGMLAVFNEHGEQIPDLQGRWEDVLPRVLLEAPANTPMVANSDWPPTVFP